MVGTNSGATLCADFSRRRARRIDGRSIALRLEGDAIGDARPLDAVAQQDLAILDMTDDRVERNPHAPEILVAVDERSGP